MYLAWIYAYLRLNEMYVCVCVCVCMLSKMDITAWNIRKTNILLNLNFCRDYLRSLSIAAVGKVIKLSFSTLSYGAAKHTDFIFTQE